MKGIKLTKFNEKLLTTTLMDIPLLKQGEVLVKMIYAPLNPADLALSKGVYGVKPQLPCTLGLEGVGKIVDCSKDVDKNILGEIVSIYSHEAPGTFAEYKAAGLRNCMRHGKKPVEESLLKQYACGMINPLTSYAHLDIVKKRKQKVFVQSLAASQVGRMNIKLAKKLGIEVINILGKNDKPLIPELKQMGAGTVLFNEDPDFYENMGKIVKQKDVKLFFDGIGGPFLEKMAALMPNGSEFWSYESCLVGLKFKLILISCSLKIRNIEAFGPINGLVTKGKPPLKKQNRKLKKILIRDYVKPSQAKFLRWRKLEMLQDIIQSICRKERFY